MTKYLVSSFFHAFLFGSVLSSTPFCITLIPLHQVKHGPTFTFVIEGRAVAPGLEFSFTKHNFGKCFLYFPGMVPASQTLVVSNKSKRSIRYVCVCVCVHAFTVFSLN